MEYGLIGEKLGHSYSKIIHEELGAYAFDLYPLAPDAVAPFLKEGGFKGLTVTIPYKQTVIPFCDIVSPLAADIGAVNTLYYNDEGKLCGTNTDYTGFLYAMDTAGISMAGRKVVILGDGATSKTIRKAAADSEASELIIVSRKIEKPVTELVSTAFCTTLSYDDLENHRDAEIIINTTPVGMWPQTEGSPVDLSLFPSCKGVFDVVYNPYYTNFLTQAKTLGLPYASGLSMLVAQATAAAGFFTGQGAIFEDENERIIEKLKKDMSISS